MKEWCNYERDEDTILKHAYMAGFPNAKFALRGQRYQYDFRRMRQINIDTGKQRDIRPPRKLTPPKKPLVPAGPTIVVSVPPGGPGTTIQVPHPKVPEMFIAVVVPNTAKVGQAMLVPVPRATISVAGVHVPSHDASVDGTHSASVPGVNPAVPEDSKVAASDDWSTGAKVVRASAAVGVVGGLAVTGAVIGDSLATHGVGATGATIADGAADIGGDIADFAGDAGDWFLDAGDDVGDFIMDLF